MDPATTPDRYPVDGTVSDAEPGSGRVASIAILIVLGAAIVAAATMWLMLADPVTVANAVDDGEISPLMQQLAQLIIDAIAGLLDYL